MLKSGDLAVLTCSTTHLEVEEIHEQGNRLISQVSMLHTSSPAKSYVKEFFSTYCEASIKQDLKNKQAPGLDDAWKKKKLS